jgi:hypothetical protein
MGAEVEYLCFGRSGNSNSRENKREIKVSISLIDSHIKSIDFSHRFIYQKYLIYELCPSLYSKWLNIFNP